MAPDLAVIEELMALEPGSVAMFRGQLKLSEEARARLDVIRQAMASANGGDVDERYCLELLREELGDPA